MVVVWDQGNRGTWWSCGIRVIGAHGGRVGSG